MSGEPTPEQQRALEQLLAGPGVIELTGADVDTPARTVAAVVRSGSALVHLVELDDQGDVAGGVICGRLAPDVDLVPRPEQLGPRPPGLWCPFCSSYLQYVRARQGLQ